MKCGGVCGGEVVRLRFGDYRRGRRRIRRGDVCGVVRDEDGDY